MPADNSKRITGRMDFIVILQADLNTLPAVLIRTFTVKMKRHIVVNLEWFLTVFGGYFVYSLYTFLDTFIETPKNHLVFN